MKKNSILFIFLTFIFSMILFSCGSVIETYTIKWINYDGTVLEMDDKVSKGTTPTYNGSVPTKVGTAEFSYTFSGWSPEVKVVEGNTTYTATFEQVTNTYTVTWKNYDGTVLEVDNEVTYGTLPSYEGTTPLKIMDSKKYVFTGWSPEVSVVEGDVTYTALFEEEIQKCCKVTWLNYDGTVLEVDENVSLNETNYSYDGDIPTKEGNAQYSYTFKEFERTIDSTMLDVKFKATFIETLNSYTVTWKNYDETVLEVDEEVLYGTLPSYDGIEPTKELEGKTYFFIGWTPEVSKVDKDIIYTAVFTEKEPLSYTVTWKNYDGTVLEIDTEVVEGSIPTYNGTTPIKVGNAQYSYIFSGWSPEITVISKDVIYTALFTEIINKYTVTWTDDNDDVLEVDENVLYGTLPSYDGSLPTKEGYVFSDWTPSISKVEGNITYKAKYIEEGSEEEKPVVSLDKKTVEYGLYPQTHVNDASLITELNKLTEVSLNGWYLYNETYYAKIKANVFNNETYTFDDGTTIVNGEEYWFKCEVIVWNILESKDGTYYLISDKLLDIHNYYNTYANRKENEQTIYANNYEQSDIRKWLNDEFYQNAFILGNKYINTYIVNNSANTSNSLDNDFVCSNTIDKVFLPSYKDLLNEAYGFEVDSSIKSLTRASKTTDYARAKGAWCNTKTSDVGTDTLYYGTYWTRTPSDEYYYCAWNVNSGGYLSSYAVDGDSHCVRPCITITINE